MVERSLSMREVRGSMPRFSIPDFQENVHFVIDKAPKSILHSTVDNIVNFFAQLMRNLCASLVDIYDISVIFQFRKRLSEVGFEPTPTFVDQNTPVRKSSTLESGALDRSAILTCAFEKISKVLFTSSPIVHI